MVGNLRKLIFKIHVVWSTVVYFKYTFQCPQGDQLKASVEKGR